jgi:hypothetical protein
MTSGALVDGAGPAAHLSPTTIHEPPMNAKFITPRCIQAIELGGTSVDGVGASRLLFGGLDPVGVSLELQRIQRGEVGPELPPRSVVAQELDVLLRSEAEVVAALGTDVQGLLELGLEVHVATVGTLLPGVRRNLQSLTLPPSAFALRTRPSKPM